MFRSFVQAGFDCTVSTNRHGRPIDSIAATSHDRRILEDYERLRQVGIRTVRDGAPWPLIQNRHGRFDWTALDRLVDAGLCCDVEIIHDLFHFGYPEGLDPFSKTFVDAYAAYCYEVALRIRRLSDAPQFITPVNEPSYFGWAAGHAALFPPYSRGRALELKVRLAEAIIAGIDAFASVSPSTTFVNVDPVCRAVAPHASPELQGAADAFNSGAVLETWDMVGGRLYPEIGGSQRHLGVLGVNYYWTNQWEFGSEEQPLPADDPRRVGLCELIAMLHRRYGADILIAETGHIDGFRGQWVDQMADQLRACRLAKLPLKGICFYPILGMTAWHSPELWLRMGLWDVADDGARVVCDSMLQALDRLRDQIE